MKLYTYLQDGKERVGAERDGYIYPVKNARDMLSLIRGGEVRISDENGIKADEAVLCAPIPRPAQDVICLGINYTEHGREAAEYNKEAFLRERPYAIYFSKRVSEAAAPGAEIDSYAGLVKKLDYECELAFIIGKDAKNVAREDAPGYIFGYTVINDISARDLQTDHKQWYFGKSLDGFTPMGPCIVTADEIGYPPVLAVKSYVNGELRQNSSTEYMVFDPVHIITELSWGMTLKAGTVIATGTPAGVGMGFDPPRFLKSGDEVVCEIEGIGRLINKIR